jgi:hypothetical protein
MNIEKTLNKICSPARFYLGVSIFFILLLIVQNLFNGNPGELCVGIYKCNISHVLLFFVIKALYVVFWTWILNLLCKHGLKNLSWFLVLIPFLLFAVGLIMFFYVALIQNSTEKNSNEQKSNKQ